MFDDVSPKVSLQSKMADFNRLRRQRTLALETNNFVTCCCCNYRSRFFAQRLTRPVSNPKNSSAAGFNTVRIMNLYYLPSDSTWAGKQAQIDLLSYSTRTYIENASSYHGDKSKQMVSFLEVLPPIVRNKKRLQSSDIQAVNTDILNDTDGGNGKNICQIIQDNNLDQVWLWVDSAVDLAVDEFTVISKTSNYGYLDIKCMSKHKVVCNDGLDYHSQFKCYAFIWPLYEYIIGGYKGDLMLGRYQCTNQHW
jgi:hypothetical protein